MEFFAAEDRARRGTLILIVLYIVSIAAIILLTDLALAIAVTLSMDFWGIEINNSQAPLDFNQVYDCLLPYLTLVVTSVIVIASWIKANELRGGGTAFGNMLGVRWLRATPGNEAEERLKNVVIEMALAAGVMTPRTCVMDNEPSINAFAAGTNNQDPVIGVTSGCLAHLTRDELQGIVAHEFSHILHNDTVLNTRAYSMFFGLLALSVIGSKMFAGGSNDDPSDKNTGCVPFVGAIAIALVVTGSLGGFIGRLVRAGIVREREFLADAAAVQYTRNADSVASTLYKMATIGSHLRHPTGEEAEHYLFGSGAGTFWGRMGLTRTHPRIADRIKAIRPGFQPSGSDAVPLAQLTDQDDYVEPGATPLLDYFEQTAPSMPGAAKRDDPLKTQNIVAPVLPIPGVAAGGYIIGAAVVAGGGAAIPGSDQPTALPEPPAAQVRKLPAPPAAVLAQIPADLRAAAGDDESAAAVCFAIAAAEAAPAKWAPLLASSADEDTMRRINTAAPAVKALPLQLRMALLDIVVPGLQALAEGERKALVDAIKAILSMDVQPDMTAMAVFWRLTRYLRSAPAAGPKAAGWSDGAVYVAELLASQARALYGPGLLAPKAYENAGHTLAALGTLPPMPGPAGSEPAEIETALCVLAAASPATRDAVVAAAAHIVAQEDIPEPRADLILRLICDAADRDIPNLFDRWV